MKALRRLLVIFALAAPTARANSPESPIYLDMEVASAGGYALTGRFMVDASSQTAWDTLVDYNGLGAFVPTVRESHLLKEENGYLYVQQTMSGQAGFLRKKISLLLQIIESKPNKIEFEDVGKKSFRRYDGTWEIVRWDNGVAITYHLNAVPNFFAPEFIANGVFKRSVYDLLENVRDEISRRSQSTAQHV